MNQVTVAGHLGADPEVRFTSSGQKVTTLRIGARARRSGKDETIWWKVTVWGELFDKMMPYFKKGSSIIVIGEMNKPEIFIDKEGKSQVSMSMTAASLFFSPFGKPEGASSHEVAAQHVEPSYAAVSDAVAYGQGKATSSSIDDEVPF